MTDALYSHIVRDATTTQYLIKSERGWWLPKGYGYTQDRAQAGRFTLADMEAMNLDGCTLYKAES